MKKLSSILTALFMIAMLAFIAAPVMAATNNMYNVTGSTASISDASAPTTLIDTTKGYIGLASVKVKQIWVDNASGNAQTIYIYQNGNSTSTVAQVLQFSVPATIGNYHVFPISNSTEMGVNADLVNIPYLVIRTSTSTTPANLTIEYVTP